MDAHGLLGAVALARVVERGERERLWGQRELRGGRFGVLGLVEFWSYAGPPLLCAALLALGPAIVRWHALVPRPGDTLAVAVVGVQVAMAVTAGCSEDARIWLWLIPLFSAAGVVALRRTASAAAPEALWVTQVVVQVALLGVMRTSQPW